MERETCTVTLVDDHHLVRAGIRALIEDLDGFSVVAESSDADAAFDAVGHHLPHIVVTDLSLPGESGIQLIERLKSSGCSAEVLVLSMHSTPDFVVSAFRAGATGYLLKDAASVEPVRIFVGEAVEQRVIRAPA